MPFRDSLILRARFLTLSIVSLTSVAGVAGCGKAATRPVAAPEVARAVPAVPVAEPAAEPAAEPTDDEIVLVIERAQGEFDLGLEILQGGDPEQAREHWDHAVEAFISSGIPLHQDDRLQRAFDRILGDIAALEARIVDTTEDEPDTEPASADALLDINATITPEKADASRERVSPGAREVTFDIPMVINDKVLAWIDLFQNNPVYRRSFEGGFQRLGHYEPMIHRILAEEGLPADLIYLAFLESTYKTNAYSRARAKGIWQFMSSTGRQYGLRLDRYVDERSHPEKSTRAAARYLKDLHGTFNDWHLAMAAYNTGAGNILRAQRRSGDRDYWSLAKSRYMHRDTKNFVPAILALALMSKDPAKYGFGHLEHFAPSEYDVVTVEGPAYISLIARLSGSDEEDIRFLNPHLRRGVTPPGYARYEVMVPAGRGDRFASAYASMPKSEKIAVLDTMHTVRTGETLASIAGRYGVTVRELSTANNISNPNRIRTGTRLTVPRGGEADTTVRASSRTSSRTSSHSGSSEHRVRRGDTLSGIARTYGVSLGQLFSWNNVNRHTILRPGMVVRVATQAQQTYRVRRGDNLFRIARKYGTTVDNIKSWNNIRGDTIRAGETLTIYAD